MKIIFDPSAPRGQQYTIQHDDGRVTADVAQACVVGALQGRGLSIREANIEVAAAKVAASTTAQA